MIISWWRRIGMLLSYFVIALTCTRKSAARRSEKRARSMSTFSVIAFVTWQTNFVESPLCRDQLFPESLWWRDKLFAESLLWCDKGLPESLSWREKLFRNRFCDVTRKHKFDRAFRKQRASRFFHVRRRSLRRNRARCSPHPVVVSLPSAVGDPRRDSSSVAPRSLLIFRRKSSRRHSPQSDVCFGQGGGRETKRSCPGSSLVTAKHPLPPPWRHSQDWQCFINSRSELFSWELYLRLDARTSAHILDAMTTCIKN